MTISKKATAMAVGLVASLAAGTLAQNGQPAGRSPDVISVDKATIDWIEKSDVAALHEGVIAKLELEVGDVVHSGDMIGQLHDELPKLKVARAELAAKNTAAQEKAQAQKQLAVAVLARSVRLTKINPTYVSQEEVQKNEAEVNDAQALLHEAQENQAIAKSELALAERELEEHKITAPFDGVITERMRNEGERVGANEPVVRMVNIDKLRVVGWVPIEYAIRIKIGSPVEVSPNIPNADLPVEKKRFRGKITFVDPEAVNEPNRSEVRVHAVVENNEAHELRPGLAADMLIYVNGALPAAAQAPAPTAPAVGALTPGRTR
jgi:RND family efflux transporter MFP subunit